MASVIKAGNATDGVQVTSDNTGILELKTGTGSGTTAVTIGTDQSVTFAGAVSSSGNQTVTGNLTVNGNTTLGDANTDTILMTASPSIGGAGLGMGFGFRNRIINGAMVIDQRNAGASVTSGFAVDRFEFQENGAAAFTIQRSTVAPAGFVNSMLVTVTTAGSATAAQVNRFIQRIEGNNIADLGFGTANASTVTLSFWVRSSLTGTYCAALVNNAFNRAYVAEYSISAANTWEYKTITIAGDTTGTWETGTSSGIQVTFDLGSGSDYNATAGSWVAANDWRTTNQVNFANTNGATFYITGVQLEKGSTATSFDYRPYGTELQLCQRYCQVFGRDTTYQGVGSTGIAAAGTSISYYAVPFRSQMRATPSVAYAGNWRVDDMYSASFAVTAINAGGNSNNTMQASVVISVASGLTTGRAYQLQTNNDTTATLTFSSEL